MAIYLYAAILALMMTGLAFNVSRLRNKHQVMFGDGGHPDLIRAQRAHGNFAEFTPFALLLIFMLQNAGASLASLHVLGITLIAARVLHAWGLLASKTPGRMAGVLLTHLVIVAAGLLCAWMYFYVPNAD